MSMLPHRKRIRIDHRAYTNPSNVCSITIATRGRQPVFADAEVAGIVINALMQRTNATGVQVHAYCTMPNHVHLLISPSEHCDIPSFIGGFKSLARRQINAAGVDGRLWQPRYYDHFLRREEDLRGAIRYILENPARAGLVEDWRHYPHCGSLVWEVDDL